MFRCNLMGSSARSITALRKLFFLWPAFVWFEVGDKILIRSEHSMEGGPS
jgi:hypothetical protein